jgi:hypothetical protein
MGVKKHSKTLSAHSRDLLAAGEGQRSDFKRSPHGISAEDLVSFANSAEGGDILAGVDEHSVNGAQIGVVMGCDVSDGAVLQIRHRSRSS